MELDFERVDLCGLGNSSGVECGDAIETGTTGPLGQVGTYKFVFFAVDISGQSNPVVRTLDPSVHLSTHSGRAGRSPTAANAHW